MGLVKRRLYKPDRKPARKKGERLPGPVALRGASTKEVVSAIAAACHLTNTTVGRGLGYDEQKDQYWVIAKSPEGKVQDFRVEGEWVADAIRLTRLLNGGPMREHGYAR